MVAGVYGAGVNRHARRAAATRVRLVEKRGARVVLMSYRLAQEALYSTLAPLSRNAARRILLAEVTRRYGIHEAKLMSPRLVSAKDASA